MNTKKQISNPVRDKSLNGANGINKKGFTILELLISIAIIAVLSSIIMVSMTGIKKQTRDTRRMSDINEIQKALNLYFTTTNRFPIFTSETIITGTDAFSTLLEQGGHITQVPTDPAYPEYAYTYQSDSTGANFNLKFCMETDSIKRFSKGCGNSVSP